MTNSCNFTSIPLHFKTNEVIGKFKITIVNILGTHFSVRTLTYNRKT